MTDQAPPADRAPQREPAAPSTSAQGLGTNLRALRLERGLRLADVAKATEISPAFLSLVENGKHDITVGRLARLVQFYDVSVLDLVPQSQTAQTEVIRKSAGQQLRSPAEGIHAFLMVSGAEHDMLAMLLVFEPRATLAEPGRHEGEEFVHVIDGTLRLELTDAPAYTLCKGDSAYYSAERPHLFANASDDAAATIMCVTSPAAL